MAAGHRFPGYSFGYHNLMMVAGADMLCEYVAEKERHPDYAVVDVSTGDNLIDGKAPDIVMTRVKKGYGLPITTILTIARPRW